MKLTALLIVMTFSYAPINGKPPTDDQTLESKPQTFTVQTHRFNDLESCKGAVAWIEMAAVSRNIEDKIHAKCIADLN